MGLYAEVDFITDWGFPEELTGGDASIGEASVPVNYSGACSAFVETFMKVATELVPVDTGYLRSTIDADTDGFSFCYAEATAEYAQYVEYGTWCMDAQPYFEIALEEACQAAGIEAQVAVEEAQQTLEVILQNMIEAARSAAGADAGGMIGGFGSFLGGMLLFVGITLLLFPLLVNVYGIMDTLFGPLTGGGSFAQGNDAQGNDFVPEVIIT